MYPMDDPFWRIFARWERRSIRRKLEDFDRQIAEARRDLARNGWNELDAELLQVSIEAREGWLKVLALMEQPQAPVGAAQPLAQALGVSGPAQLAPPDPTLTSSKKPP